MRRLTLALALVATGAGCGGEDSEGTPALTAGRPLGLGGTLVWAVADRGAAVDPLVAETRAEELIGRQIHEPLTATASGPFGDTREVPGLARNARPAGDATVWSVRLRRGVRFQDGTQFNAEAVLVNAARWRTTAAGQALLPNLVEAFAPRFDEVRFILDAPVPDFDERLEAPALGIVSPRALRPRSGVAATLRRSLDTGTGPFELRERGPGRRLLARNSTWWGTRADPDLGPALEQVEFRGERSAALRLAVLDAGDAQLAGELGRDQAELALADPLLHALRGSEGEWLGLSRSVRGIDSAREIPSLAGAWLTTVTAGD